MQLPVTRAPLLLSLLALGFVASGCGKDDCEKLYDQEKKCSDGYLLGMSKSEFVSRCKSLSSTPEAKRMFAAELACSAKSCAEARTCKDALYGKNRAVEVTRLVSVGDYDEAFTLCTIEDYYADPAFKAACASVFASLDGLTVKDLVRAKLQCDHDDKLKAISPEFAALCTSFAEAMCVGPAAEATSPNGENAKILCSELVTAQLTKEAIAESRENLKAKKPVVPDRCTMAIKGLAAITSDWSHNKLTDVLTACYGDLGPMIIQVNSGDAKFNCPYYIVQVLRAATQFDLYEKFPALTNVPDTCKKHLK